MQVTCDQCGHAWATNAQISSTITCKGCGNRQRVRHFLNAATGAKSAKQQRTPEPASASTQVRNLPARRQPIAPVVRKRTATGNRQQQPEQLSEEERLRRLAISIRTGNKLSRGPGEVFEPELPPRALLTEPDGSVIATIAVRIKRPKKQRQADCARCGARVGYNTPALFRVSSSALDRINQAGIVLCLAHARQEMSEPGCEVVRYA